MNSYKPVMCVLFALLFLISATFALEVRITPEDPTTDDDLTCSVVGVGSGEAGVFEYNWYRNGARLGTRSNVLFSSMTSTGDRIACYVTDFFGGFVGYDETTIAGKMMVTNRDPNVEIVRPADGSSFLISTLVTFEADGSDPDGNSLTYSWNFGDGITRSGSTVAHRYTDRGSYRVRASVSDGRGGSDFDEISVTITGGIIILNIIPVADAGEDRTVAVGEDVAFDGSGSSDSDGTIVSYEWSFGDGTSATGVSAEHAYTEEGTYTVTLTVTDDDGASDTDEAVVVVESGVPTENEPPIAVIVVSDSIVFLGDEIIFDGSESYDTDGEIVEYLWDFSDGSSGSGDVVRHTFVRAGWYFSRLTVVDNDGATDTERKVIFVLPSFMGNDPPVADAGRDRTAVAGESIVLDGSGSFDSDGEIVEYLWDFGDGTSASGIAVSHEYADDGTYTARLTVADNEGATDSDEAVVVVGPGIPPENEPPVADAGEDMTVAVGEDIVFDGSGSYDLDGTIVSYEWDFGDGTNADGEFVEHAYSEDGTYTATLTVEDDDGATDSDSAAVFVSETGVVGEPPVAIINVDSTNVFIGRTVHFDGSGSFDPDGEIVEYFWDFGDGTSGNGVFAEHPYTESGIYNVNLIVRDNDGNEDKNSVIINVNVIRGFDRERRNVNPDVRVPSFGIGMIVPSVEGSYSAGENVALFVKLTNEFGPSEDFDLVVDVPELNYHYTINNIALSSSEVKWVTVPINLPGSASDGVYIARLNLMLDEENDDNKLAYWQFVVN